jgi:hypothetical protein
LLRCGNYLAIIQHVICNILMKTVRLQRYTPYKPTYPTSVKKCYYRQRIGYWFPQVRSGMKFISARKTVVMVVTQL